MRVLHITHSLPFLNQAGTEVYTYSLCQELSKRHQVSIFSRMCDEGVAEYTVSKSDNNGIRVYLINNTFHLCDSFEMYYANPAIDDAFEKVLREINPEVVHIQHLIFLSIGLLKRINERGIPVIFTLHDYWLVCPAWNLLRKDLERCEKAFTGNFDGECLYCLDALLNVRRGAKRTYRLARRILPYCVVQRLKSAYFACAQKVSPASANLERLAQRRRAINELVSRVNVFLAPSEYLKNRFIDFGIPEEKIYLLRFGLGRNSVFDTAKKKKGKLTLGFIGTLLPAKGLHILIQAVNGIKEENIELRIYGKMCPYIGFEWYLPYIKKISRHKGIRFMGEFEHDNIGRVLEEISVLVVPSIWSENSPLVILEAFLSKTPVIASRIGGIPEMVRDGVNGLLCKPKDVDDLREKVTSLISNPLLLDRLTAGILSVKPMEDHAKEIQDTYIRLTQGLPVHNAHDVR